MPPMDLRPFGFTKAFLGLLRFVCVCLCRSHFFFISLFWDGCVIAERLPTSIPIPPIAASAKSRSSQFQISQCNITGA